MAIDTTNKKLALMEWESFWEPGLPISPGTIGQDDKQQFVWGYPGILWASVAEVETPTCRIYVVPAEARVFTVPAGC